jgi:hypothetical protein
MALALASSLSTAAQSSKDSTFIRSVYTEALNQGECYENLRVLCKDIGNRLAGSERADKAIAWGKQVLSELPIDSVYLMPVEVPHWVRGNVESATMIQGNNREVLHAVALGGSVGSNGKVVAEIVEVKSFEELESLGAENIKGKIVFFNKALDAALINTGAAYGRAYDIRGKGPVEAARYGAVGCIIRSLTTAEDNFPHTGSTRYNDSIPAIPAMALSSVDSRKLSDALKKDHSIKLEMELNCVNLPRKIQYNVIGEIRGTEFPDHIITVGGHLDSWDIGEGAHDDGTGVVQSIEVLRTLGALNYKPKHTVRCVLFINEEFGNDGGETYAKETKLLRERHLAAIESDGGGFSPKGFSMQGDDAHLELLKQWGKVFEPYEMFSFKAGWSGVDIGPLQSENTTLYGLQVDSQRYFDVHHSPNDVFENVNKREVTLGSAAMASLVYLIDQHDH